MLSVHPLASGFPISGFRAEEESNVHRIAEYVQAHVWSPIVWAASSRSEDNFACCLYAVLDFDEERTIDDVRGQLADQQLSYWLGATKSHQIAKGGKPPCDRFRVVIPFSEMIWDVDTFRWNMKRIIKEYRSDPMGYDAARIWQPCRKGVEFSGEGRTYAVDRDVPEEETRAHRADMAERWAEHRRTIKVLPRATLHFLRAGLGNQYNHRKAGGRNKSLYFAAVSLLEFGWDLDRTRRVLRAVPGMLRFEGFEDTLRSAARRAGVEYER